MTTERRRGRGRPPRVTDGRSRQRVEVRLTDAELADLELAARTSGTTVAGLIREAINEYVTDFRDEKIFVR